MVLMLVKFHAWKDRQKKAEFLTVLAVEAYNLLQLSEDLILTSGFWICLRDGELPLQPEEVEAHMGKGRDGGGFPLATGQKTTTHASAIFGPPV